MSHSDPTTLALAALGEDIPTEDSDHLFACEQCLAEVAELSTVVTVAREAPLELPDVPDHVWAGIRTELGLLAAPDGADVMVGSVPPASAADEPSQPAPLAPVVPLRRRWGRLAAVGAMAAAVGALIGGGVVYAALESSTRTPGGSPTLVAQAVLDPLSTDVPEAGQAEVLDSPDGQVVRVDATGLPDNDGFYEVWLIDSEVTKLVALGALPAGAVGTFTVPPGVSIEDFPVVDISLEPLDGDPGHSKKSLMRGTLEA